MKLKLKLDRDAMKAFALHHAEKVVFGVVALCFLAFVYAAIARERLGFSPEELSARAKKAVENIERTPKEVGLREVPDFPKLAVINYKPVDSKWYQLATRFDSPLKEKRRTRGTPAVLPLEKPQAAAGNGAFAMQDLAMAGNLQMRPASPNKGQRWVVITGLLPFAKQKQEYESAFRGAEGQPALPGGYMADASMPAGSPMMSPGYGGAMMSPGYGASGSAGSGARVELPVYAYYRVQRAEVVRGDEDPEELQWNTLDIRKSFLSARLWRSTGGEAVAPIYLHAGPWPMAFPLGPLVDKSWGPEVAHEPEIKFLERSAAMGSGYMAGGAPGMTPDMSPDMMMAGMVGPYPGAKPPKGAKTDKGSAKKPKPKPEELTPAPKPMPKLELLGPDEPGTLGGSPMGPGAFSGMMPPGSMMPSDAGSTPYGMSPGMPYGMSPGMPYGAGAEYSPDATMGAMSGVMGMPGGVMPQAIEYQLFRFFDFDVEPGKQYRYRVRLVLANPNYQMNPLFLEDEKQSKIPYLEEKGEDDERGWSEPTPAVFVPRDGRVLVASVNMPRDQHLAVMEPTATFGVVRFAMDTGETLFQEFPDPEITDKNIPGKIYRGQLANFRGVPKPTLGRAAYGSGGYPGMPYDPGGTSYDPSSDAPMSAPTPPGPGSLVGGPRTTETQEPETTDFLSDYLLVDLSGGRTIPGKAKLQEPSRILWLDPAGNLTVRTDIADQEEYEKLKPPEEPAGPRGRTMTGAPPGYAPGSAYPPGTSPGSPPSMDYSTDPAGMDLIYMQQMQKGGAKGRKPPPKPRRSTGS